MVPRRLARYVSRMKECYIMKLQVLPYSGSKTVGQQWILGSMEAQYAGSCGGAVRCIDGRGMGVRDYMFFY